MGKFKRIDTSIDGVCIIEPTVFGDNRGYFMETYSKADFEEIGLNYNFIQDNQSKSKKGVLRGLHFQKENTQAKLVRCIKGEVFDVAVDLRPGSKTYGKWEGVVLTEENKKMFMIPKGFAHGFLVLSEEAEFAYKCDDIYNHEAEGGLKWNDPDVGIDWPMGNLKVEDLITSEKDGKWPSLKELKEIFGNINIVVAKELTKIHETFYRGTIEEVLEKMGEIKGEFIVMFEVHSKTEKELEIEELSKKTIEEQYTYYEKQGLSKKDIIKTIAKNNNVPKDVIYKQFI